MLGLKLNYVSRRGPSCPIIWNTDSSGYTISFRDEVFIHIYAQTSLIDYNGILS